MSRAKGSGKAGLAELLQAEAQDMELKLLALRKAMEVERAKRESLLGNNNSGGSLWKNGGNGLLRSNFRAKQGPGQGSPKVGAAGEDAGGKARSASAATRSPQLQQQPQQQQASPQQEAGQARTRTPPQDLAAPSVSARALHVAPAAPRLAAFRPKREADLLTVHQDDGPSGTACGADNDDHLAAGAFDEADSHRSFLEALQEWRRANKGEAEGEAGSSAAASSSTPSAGQQRRPKPEQGAPMEVQTEAGPSSRQSQRPVSGKSSYFNKFMINAAARQAGIAAGGELPSRPQSARPASGSPSLRASMMRPSSSPRSGPSPPDEPLGSQASSSAVGANAAGGSSGGGAARGAASSAARPVSASTPQFSLLERLDQLEQLELERTARDAEDDDDDDGGRLVEVTTQKGLGLTKGVRLPDAILVPEDGAS